MKISLLAYIKKIALYARNVDFSPLSLRQIKEMIDMSDKPVVKKWVSKKFRTWLINNYPGRLIRKTDLVKSWFLSAYDERIESDKKAKEGVIKAVRNGTPVYRIIINDKDLVKFNHWVWFLDNFVPEGDVARLSPEDVENLIEEQEEKKKSKKFDENALGGELTIHTYNTGFRWVRLISKEACVREGKRMNNCIGELHVKDIVSGKEQAFSLKDKNNKPHIDLAIKDGIIIEIKGNSNAPVKQEFTDPYLLDFLNKKRAEFTKVDEDQLYYGRILKYGGKYINTMTTVEFLQKNTIDIIDYRFLVIKNENDEGLIYYLFDGDAYEKDNTPGDEDFYDGGYGGDFRENYEEEDFEPFKVDDILTYSIVSITHNHNNKTMGSYKYTIEENNLWVDYQGSSKIEYIVQEFIRRVGITSISPEDFLRFKLRVVDNRIEAMSDDEVTESVYSLLSKYVITTCEYNTSLVWMPFAKTDYFAKTECLIHFLIDLSERETVKTVLKYNDDIDSLFMHLYSKRMTAIDHFDDPKDIRINIDLRSIKTKDIIYSIRDYLNSKPSNFISDLQDHSLLEYGLLKNRNRIELIEEMPINYLRGNNKSILEYYTNSFISYYEKVMKAIEINGVMYILVDNIDIYFMVSYSFKRRLVELSPKTKELLINSYDRNEALELLKIFVTLINNTLEFDYVDFVKVSLLSHEETGESPLYHNLVFMGSKQWKIEEEIRNEEDEYEEEKEDGYDEDSYDGGYGF